jgi:hypothetical protein
VEQGAQAPRRTRLGWVMLGNAYSAVCLHLGMGWVHFRPPTTPRTPRGGRGTRFPRRHVPPRAPRRCCRLVRAPGGPGNTTPSPANVLGSTSSQSNATVYSMQALKKLWVEDKQSGKRRNTVVSPFTSWLHGHWKPADSEYEEEATPENFAKL